MTKRTLKTLSLGDKLKIISEIDSKSDKKMDIAKKYGIPSSTLSTIIKNRDRIVEFAVASAEPDRKRIKQSRFPQVEEEVWKWILSLSDQSSTLSGTTIRKKAQSLAEELGYPEFQASGGWLEKFRARHNLKACGKKKVMLITEAKSLSDSSHDENEEEFILPARSPQNDEILESTSPVCPVPDIVIKQEFSLADDEFDWNLQTSARSPNSPSSDLSGCGRHLQRQSESPLTEDNMIEEVSHAGSEGVVDSKPVQILPLAGSSNSIPAEARRRNAWTNIPNVVHHRSQVHETKKASLLTQNSANSQYKDHLDIFGDYVVTKLKRMDPRTRILAQKAINNAIFETEMRVFDGVGTDASSSSFVQIPSSNA